MKKLVTATAIALTVVCAVTGCSSSDTVAPVSRSTVRQDSDTEFMNRLHLHAPNAVDSYSRDTLIDVAHILCDLLGEVNGPKLASERMTEYFGETEGQFFRDAATYSYCPDRY